MTSPSQLPLCSRPQTWVEPSPEPKGEGRSFKAPKLWRHVTDTGLPFLMREPPGHGDEGQSWSWCSWIEPVMSGRHRKGYPTPTQVGLRVIRHRDGYTLEVENLEALRILSGDLRDDKDRRMG